MTKQQHAGPGPARVKSGIFTFDKIVAVILLLVFALVIITGVFTYRRLDRIVTTVSTSIRPDEKLLLVKEIFNKLSDAENAVKSYSLTRNEEYLGRFFQTVQETESRFEKLRRLVAGTDTLQPYIDSLDVLVEEKFIILDCLLDIRDEYLVQQALNKVLVRLEESWPSDTVISDTIISEYQSEPVRALPQKQPGFFARLFGKRMEPAFDTLQPVRDTLIVELPGKGEPSFDQITRELQVVGSAEVARETIIRAQELEFIRQDKQVNDKIRDILEQMEQLERNSYGFRTREAENNAEEIRVIIAYFCIAASLLLVLAAFIIARGVRSNNRYRSALQKAGDEARELARTRELFLANMSHEIRTPMNVISGFTSQLMQTDMGSGQKEQLGMVRKSADHLLHILNDILDYSKLEAGKMTLSETMVDLPGLVDDIVQQFKPIAKEKDNRLKAVCDPALPRYIKGDAVRLRQILFNVVGNAVKFTRSGEVVISASAEKTDKDKAVVRIEVTDTGIGISEKDLERIFREFEQATGASGQASGGTGLGLTITRKLIDLHHGSIGIKSEHGKGTAVTITLPYSRWEGGLPVKDEVGKQAVPLPEGLRVLVADDEEFNRKLLKAILAKHGCEVHEAAGGMEALRLVESEPFDLLLTDNRMPDLGGVELCRRIRSLTDQEAAGMPVIVITAAISRSDQQEYAASGMDGFIPKPFEEADLVEAIHRALGKRNVPPRADSAKRPDYDLNELKRLGGEDPAFLKEMLELFIQNTEKGFEALQKMLDDNDRDAMAGQAHKMAAPCRHIKAEKLYGLLKGIEQNKPGPAGLKHMEELVAAARMEFERIRDDIEKHGSG